MVKSEKGRVEIIGKENVVLGEFATIILGMFDTCDTEKVLKTMEKVLTDIRKKGTKGLKDVQKKRKESKNEKEFLEKVLEDEDVPNYIKEIIREEILKEDKD